MLTSVILSRSEAEAKNLVETSDTFQEYHQHALLRVYALRLLNRLPRASAQPPPPEIAPTGEGTAALPSPAVDGGRAGDGGFASRHAAYYRRFAQEQNWRTVEHFFDQIDHGWQWVQANAPAQFIGYVFATQDFLFMRGRQIELLELLDKALAHARHANDRLNEGTLLNEIGRVCDNTGRPQDALRHFEQAVIIYRELKIHKYELFFNNRSNKNIKFSDEK